MFVQIDERHQDDDNERNKLVVQLSIQALQKIRDGEGDCGSPLPGITYRQLFVEIVQNNRRMFTEEERTMTAEELRKAFTRKPCARLMALNQREAEKQVIKSQAYL